MARKVHVDLSDTINGFRLKTNTISNLIGDLDNLSAEYTGYDSDIVQALNFSKDVRRAYTASGGILKTALSGNLTGDSSGVFTVAGGHGLTQEASGLKLEDMPANTVKVRDAGTAGASSNKAVIDEQILIGDGTGFTSAALSQDVLMTNAGVVTIQPDVVTNAKLANMAAVTMKVNATAAATDPQDLVITPYAIPVRAGSGIIAPLTVNTSTVVGRTSSGNIISAQVATDQIADDAVTYGKIQDIVTANRVLGKTSAGTVEEVQIQTDMISDDQVTNAKLANMPANSVKVGNSASAAGPSDITVANTQILIGDGSGFTAAGLSGHVTMTNAGACTVSGGEADFVKVEEKNDNVNYQILFSDNNGTGYQRPYIDTDNAHLMYNPSTQTLSSGTIAGNASSANFADLAEKYTTSEEHPTGTVMMASFNEIEETSPCTSNGVPVGVISAQPAYLMNAGADGQALGLKGRVPVRVVGAVHKGDPVYTHHNGCAGKEFNGAMMVGVALESSTAAEEKLIECILKV